MKHDLALSYAAGNSDQNVIFSGSRTASDRLQAVGGLATPDHMRPSRSTYIDHYRMLRGDSLLETREMTTVTRRRLLAGRLLDRYSARHIEAGIHISPADWRRTELARW